jgi:hypothetical protein
MTPLQLLQYYANLLILQYLQKPKAYATAQTVATNAILPQTTVQTIAFSGIAASGTFILNYTAFGTTTPLPSSAINWNDTASAIQTKLQAITGLGSVTVTGSIATSLVITFTGVPPVAPLLTVTSNSLTTAGSAAIALTITQTDTTLPLALAQAFNLNSTFGAVAIGNQLTPLGKYVGVTRTGTLSTGSITLSDADFLTLIQFAALKNSAGSDLSSMQNLLHQFFPNEVLVFDYQNMQMSYLISSSIGSQNLAKLLVAENLLFRPMGVQLAATTYAPIITTFFGFRTYTINTANNTPFNSYTSYNMSRPWLSYANALTT